MASAAPASAATSAATVSAGGMEAAISGSVRASLLVGRVEHLGGVVQSLAQDVRSVEACQAALDRRLVEFQGLVQGLQERSSKAATAGAHRALTTAVSVRRQVEQEDEWQDCMTSLSKSRSTQLEQPRPSPRLSAQVEEHERRLRQLGAELALIVNALAPEARLGAGHGGPGHDLASNGNPVLALGQRIAALEQGQKTVAVGARRALHTALVVHQQQQSQDHDSQWEKCPDAVPVADLEQQCAHRFVEQDERLDRLVQMVDTLIDRVLLTQPLEDGQVERGRVADIDASLRAKVDEIEANLYGLAAEMQHHRPMLVDSASGQSLPELHGPTREAIMVAVESLEARVDRSVSELCQRLDALQDGRDQQRLALRQLSKEVPEVAHKLDQLWSHCQHYFPRVKEHDVHFSLFRTSFENHKQHMLEFTDGLEQRERSEQRSAARAVTPGEARADVSRASSTSRSLSPGRLLLASSAASGVPSASLAPARTGDKASGVPSTSLALARPGDEARAATAATPPLAAPPPPPQDLSTADAPSTSTMWLLPKTQSVLGSFPCESPETDDPGGRSPMLSQLIARLHSGPGGPGAEREVDAAD